MSLFGVGVAQKPVLINPNLVVQKNDPFTTGIVYLPVSLAWFAGTLKGKGYQCQVIDAFGEKPNQFQEQGKFLFRGLTPREVVSRVPGECQIAFVYASNVTYHNSVLSITRALRESFPKLTIVILENTQAVTAYSLRRVQQEFYQAGANYVLTGEAEERGVELLQALESGASGEDLRKIDGLGFLASGGLQYSPPSRKIADLDSLPLPAWDLFPLANYWRLGYAHGPLTSRKYLPVLSSRGCPYPCRFCVIPETNDQRWRGRSAEHVVSEMEHFQKTLGVSEFHFEDVDPTVNDVRTQALCREILRRDLKVVWKISSGTKVETIKSETTVELMAKSGCRYVSISPESGSASLMKKMGKPFAYPHAVKMIRHMKRVGIRTQACFVLGFPGEQDEDRELTRKMVRDLVRAGLDEIAQFIITPVPGSAIFDQLKGYTDYSELNFSPAWREDYAKLNRFRITLYRQFLFWKLRYQPLSLLKQPFNFLFRNFETKMEMAPYRALHTVLKVRLDRVYGS